MALRFLSFSRPAGRTCRWLAVSAFVVSSQLVTTSASATTLELSSATVADLRQAMDSGALSSEQLVQLYLARIAAYDQQGPRLNTVITLNPHALTEARALDVERRQKGPRSPLHGIPVVLKDNYDTADLPTTAGCIFLAGSIPAEDAFLTARLRAAGAIILAKTNTSEFALSGKSNGFSSMGGQTRNPHDLQRGPAGSSGGSGAAVAAWLAPIAFGSDTGGSVRGPSAANGIVGLKPTLGLLSRSGIVPLALSFDTGGPMTRSVYDLAATLGVVAGVDPRDAATAPSRAHLHADYTRFLKPDALQGARLGLLRDFMGADPEVDAVVEAAATRLRALGATVVEVKLPPHLLQVRASLFSVVRHAEFKAQINDYLAGLKPGFPRSHDELRARAQAFLARPPAQGHANRARWEVFEVEAAEGLPLDDPRYLAARDHGLTLVRETLAGCFAAQQLDAMIYATAPLPAQLLERDYDAPAPASATNLANFSGFPDLIVPAGATSTKLPVTLSFLGLAWSEPKLLGYGFAFEQATHARINPSSTPALPGETLTY